MNAQIHLVWTHTGHKQRHENCQAGVVSGKGAPFDRATHLSSDPLCPYHRLIRRPTRRARKKGRLKAKLHLEVPLLGVPL